MPRKHPKREQGPTPEKLRLDGPWEAAVDRALGRRRTDGGPPRAKPAEGEPAPQDADQKPDKGRPGQGADRPPRPPRGGFSIGTHSPEVPGSGGLRGPGPEGVLCGGEMKDTTTGRQSQVLAGSRIEKLRRA